MSVLKTYGADKTSFKPSNTYQIKGNRLEGLIDGIDAVKQSVDLILSIERYENIIYSWDYGNELKGFIGKDRTFVQGDIERRIRESLLEDDRVESISNFQISFKGECAFVSFTVYCIFGEFEVERGVAIGK